MPPEDGAVGTLDGILGRAEPVPIVALWFTATLSGPQYAMLEMFMEDQPGLLARINALALDERKLARMPLGIGGRFYYLRNGVFEGAGYGSRGLKVRLRVDFTADLHPLKIGSQNGEYHSGWLISEAFGGTSP